jgi:hypothetical protein
VPQKSKRGRSKDATKVPARQISSSEESDTPPKIRKGDDLKAAQEAKRNEEERKKRAELEMHQRVLRRHE